MRETKDFACTGPICNPTILKVDGISKDHTIFYHTAELNRNGEWLLRDGWAFVKSLGACCPRCLEKLGLKKEVR